MGLGHESNGIRVILPRLIALSKGRCEFLLAFRLDFHPIGKSARTIDGLASRTRLLFAVA